MCGRFIALSFCDIQQLLNGVKQTLPLEPIAFGEVFPTNNCFVRLQEGFTTMPWGIMPSWEKAKTIINARQETVLEKTFFKNDFKEHRCIVYAQGFYEWDKDKHKYEVVREDGKTMYFAGLYKIDKGTAQFVLMTQAATSGFMHIHDRLPLILEENELEDYLKGRNLDVWTIAKSPNLKWKIV